jgi:SAM-dependent methyltransferase
MKIISAALPATSGPVGDPHNLVSRPPNVFTLGNRSRYSLLDSSSLYAMLRCPFCRSGLTPSAMAQVDEEDYGILTCNCSEYPVVAGIPVIKKGVIGPLGESATKVIDLIRAGEYYKVLLILSRPPTATLRQDADQKRLFPSVLGARRHDRKLLDRAVKRWDKSARALLVNKPNVMAVQLLDLYFNDQQKDPYDYFRYRFSQPRHLVALSLASIIPKSSRPVLDLGCGFGHVTRGVYNQTNGSVIGADNVFFTLLTARRTIAPLASYVYCDANIELPFPSNSFSAAISSNVFHFIENKSTCIRELNRVTDRNLIILASVRHAGFACDTRNSALPLEGYERLKANIPHRIILDSDTLERYLDKKGPALAQSGDAKDLGEAAFISIVASKDEKLFRDYGELKEWCHEKGHLGLNPIYKATPDLNNCMRLTRNFPSKFYQDENEECERYLPAEVAVRAEVLDDLRAGKRTREIEKLIEQFVVLDIPPRYG